jgi:thiol-disulfide isomerase/thioredoxin
MRKELYLIVTVVLLLILSACSAAQSEDSPETSSKSQAAEVVASDPGDSAKDAAANDSADSEMAASDEGQGVEHDEQPPTDVVDQQATEPPAADDSSQMTGIDRPAWQKIALTNARTGESFTLADFEGKTVFVEPMATWCSNCRRQLTNVREARQQLASDDVVFVGLSVETTIGDAELANYADDAGFDWLFAVMTPELLSELAGEFGRAIANPPATPHFVIRPDGTSTDLVTGIEPAAQLIAQITSAQG